VAQKPSIIENIRHIKADHFGYGTDSSNEQMRLIKESSLVGSLFPQTSYLIKEIDVMSMKKHFARQLKKLMDAGNKVGTRFVPPAFQVRYRRLHTTTGHAKRFHLATPNAKKKATKPCIAGMARTFGFCRGGTAAPTIDQVKKLEDRIGLRVRVRDGQCYVGDSELLMPIGVTLDEAGALLDQHLATV